MSSSKNSALFKPLRVGNMLLQHRVVLAPMTRFRASDDNVTSDLSAEYYAQRASTPGTLLITEATIIAPQAGGFANVPGIWNEQQIAAYKKVADAVHAKGSFIFLQLWAMGRPANAAILQKDGYDVVGPSAIPCDDKHPAPRPLAVEEIKEYVQLYAQAAKAALGAGFDGVEIQSANGYLLDQFLQTNSNARTDEYGGSIENRLRFLSEVLDAVTDAIGQERTSLRLSPWSTFWGMRMPDPISTFSALAQLLVARYPRLAYLHVIEPRVLGSQDIAVGDGERNDFIRKIWAPRPIVLAGGFNRELAMSAADSPGETVLTAMGRYFTSNPDLPKRWLRDVALTPYERATFASPGPKGYTDWPFHSEDVLAQ
ncbi:NADH:flavin oxidoreductase/NADH oxidase [Peniophora sp. CONT]|nr:NADH:flavin oxidoreductase/NADH oxidase [Peniophora sp. CONT]